MCELVLLTGSWYYWNDRWKERQTDRQTECCFLIIFYSKFDIVRYTAIKNIAFHLNASICEKKYTSHITCRIELCNSCIKYFLYNAYLKSYLICRLVCKLRGSLCLWVHTSLFLSNKSQSNTYGLWIMLQERWICLTNDTLILLNASFS